MNAKIKSALLLIVLLIAVPASAEEVTITVKGMVCSFCAQGIKKTFGKKEGVTEVNVDLDKKTVTLRLNEKSQLSDKDIEQAIIDSGYDVVKLERTKDNG